MKASKRNWWLDAVALGFLAWAVLRWPAAYKAQKENQPRHIVCGVGNQKVADFWTTNPTYVCMEWQTNSRLEVVGRVVTNRW